MAAKKKILKLFIIIILAVFLLSTWLISVLYLGGSKNTIGTGDALSWDLLSWNTDVQSWNIATWTVDTKNIATWASTIKTVEIWTVSPIIAGTWTK